MPDIKLLTSKPNPESVKKFLTIAAQSLLSKWLKGQSVATTLAKPGAEDLIIFAAKEIRSPQLREKWLQEVRGDGKNKRRLRLVKKCAKAIKERYGQ